MAKSAFAILGPLLLVTVSPAGSTGFEHLLKPGRYRIDVIAENPKTGERTTIRQISQCIDASAITNHAVFGILSQTKASGCPNYEICAGRDRTGFIAQC